MPASPPAPAALALPETLAALTLATDVANGQPFEAALRTCFLAVSLARTLGAPRERLADVYYASQLRFVGCTAYSHEMSESLGGDDTATHRLFAPLDPQRLAETAPRALAGVARGEKPLRRARAAVELVVGAPKLFAGMAAGHCEVGARLATRLHMPEGVVEALSHIYERWDGRGQSRGLEGEGVSWVARVVQIARMAELHVRMGGLEAVRDMLRKRGGTQLDPTMANAFAAEAPQLLTPLTSTSSVWDDVLALADELSPPAVASVDEIAAAFADFADLKSSYAVGHSTAVAAVADDAARQLGLDDEARSTLRRAALLHDLGQVSVPTGVLEKRGSLTAAETEVVRLHPYYTERILKYSRELEAAAKVAGAHHERPDASGYPHGLGGPLLPRLSRLLAAADVYRALCEPRPHRPALPAESAAAELERLASEAHLDREAVAAVLDGAGQTRRARHTAWPAGLSEREVEVLRLVARGQTNKQIAGQLSISAKTVQHHISHVYAKVGVSTRAGAALFASEHGIL